ncbi:hypothetical protein PFISCL1PPCAC_13155, partial [Pristionchus fissidentatus]
MLISINRFAAIIFPWRSRQYITVRSTWMAVMLALLLSVLHCLPILVGKDMWFCYDRTTMRWVFSGTKQGEIFESGYNNAYLRAFAGLRFFITMKVEPSVQNSNKLSNRKSRESRKMEIRLFKQAFSQSVPLILTFCSFAYITPLYDDDFHKFLSTTLVWHIAHGLDG